MTPERVIQFFATQRWTSIHHATRAVSNFSCRSTVLSFIAPESVSHRKLAGALLAGFFAGPAQATGNDSFFFRGGPAYAKFDASTYVKIDGAAVPGGDTGVSTNTGPEFELG